MAEIYTKLNQQRTIKNEKSTNFEDLIINIIKTQQCAIEYQSSVPSIWHRLLPYLKVIEEMEKQQQQQNNQEQNQYHLYKEQKLSIKSLSKSSSTTPPSSAISLENKYEGNENKNNITFENQQEVLLSSYLSSLESFQYEILLSSISISSLLIPTTTVTQTTETLIVSISSLGLSSLSSSPVSSMLSKKILKNSMTEIIIKTIKYQNNFHINDIQMTTDVVNIINFDIYINNNGIVTILLKFIFKSDDILYEKKFDVSDCKLLNFSKNHLNNSNFNNSNNNNSSYINNYNNNDDDINFCSPFKYNNNKIVKTRTIIINVSSIIKKADVNAVALIKNYNNNNNDNVTTNDKNLNSAMQITIIKSALNADKNNNINTIKSIQTITNMITDDININNNNDYNKRNYSNYNKNEHVIFPVNFSLFNSPKYNNISSNINNLAMKNNINIKKNIINNKLKNYIITINNKNIKKGNPNKNTTILPTRLKLNSNINKYNYENINEINECININNIKNNYKLININNLKFGWCCWHNLNFIFSIFLIILIGLSSKCLAAKQDVGKECTFPPLWEGSWFLSGYQQSVHIKGSQFSYRGKCKAAEGNKYLIVDEKGCHRCLVIYEKHKNVLQYKESECEGDTMYMMDQSINPAAMPMRTIVKSSDNSHSSHLLNIRGREAHPNSNGHSQFTSSDRYIMRSNDDNNDCPSGFCRGREILQNLCDQIPGDALLFSLFREQAEPVKCPLRGPFTFTYNRGHGECRNPVSNIESCTDESRLLLNFQACPDVQGTESAAEELTCLATWKDGNSRYLVGLVSHHHAISNEERYRCFVYEKISTMMGGFNGGVSNVNSKDAEYKLAQSGDATCNGLDSAEVGSRIMTLRKPPLAERCDFPTWFKGPRHWHGLMGKSQYTYHQGDGSLIIKRINSNYETRAFCEQINKQTSTEMMAVVHHTTGCQSGFMCMMFYRRDIHIAEIQMGAPANRLEDACAPDHFDITKLPYITLLSNEPTDHTCPLEGLYKLHGAIGPPHKISRHKRNHNNKGHIQHNHHHIQLFQQQQLQQQQQQQKQIYEREHDFIYNHNKRNVEHEFSSASLILPSSSSLSSTSISANGIASSVASISMSSLLSSSSSLLPSTGIKRHGTFSFQNSDETTQLPTLPLEPPLVLAVGEADILSSSLSSSSSSSSASSLPYYKKHFNGNNENGIEINGNSGTIVNYRQLHTNILNNEQQEQRRLRRRRRKRETKLFNRIDLNHEQENFQILKENNNERIEILSNGIISSPSIDLTTTIISDLTNIAQIPINVNTDELSISNTNKNNYNNNNNNNDNNNNSNNDDNNDTTITNANSNNHYNKEIHFNKKLIKDFIEMKKSLKMLETSRRHEIENESLSELSISPSSTKIILSSQKLPLSSSPSLPSSTNTNISLSNSNNKDNKDSGNNNNKKKSKNNNNNNNNNNNSNDNELTVKINAHQSKIEILNQRSRRDTPGCIVNYKEQRYFTIGCNDDKNVIEVETKQQCDLEGDEVYYCHGHWIENGTVYVIAKNSATSHAVCITYQPQEGAGNLETKLMIVGDSCLRGQMKPPEHHLVATIKKAGKCGDPSSSTIQSINLFLFIIAFGSTILFTNR